MDRVAFWFFPGPGFSLLQSELFSTSFVIAMFVININMRIVLVVRVCGSTC